MVQGLAQFGIGLQNLPIQGWEKRYIAVSQNHRPLSCNPDNWGAPSKYNTFCWSSDVILVISIVAVVAAAAAVVVVVVAVIVILEILAVRIVLGIVLQKALALKRPSLHPRFEGRQKSPRQNIVQCATHLHHQYSLRKLKTMEH